MLQFLLGDSLLRKQIDQIQAPIGCDFVAIGIGFGEMIAGIEKEDWNLRIEFDSQLCEQHIFCLEAACQADILSTRNCLCESCAHFINLGACQRLYLRGTHWMIALSERGRIPARESS